LRKAHLLLPNLRASKIRETLSFAYAYAIPSPIPELWIILCELQKYVLRECFPTYFAPVIATTWGTMGFLQEVGRNALNSLQIATGRHKKLAIMVNITNIKSRIASCNLIILYSDVFCLKKKICVKPTNANNMPTFFYICNEQMFHDCFNLAKTDG
jgi:hypothetical protein